MAESDFWGDNPDAWDTLSLAGEEIPGIVDLDGEISQKMDAAAPKGSVGQRWEWSGRDIPRLTITVVMWTAEHWKAYKALLPKIMPTEQQPEGIDAAHPVLRLYKITTLVIHSVSFPKSQGQDAKGRQIKTVTIKAGQYRPVTKKVAGAGTGGTGAAANAVLATPVAADLTKIPTAIKTPSSPATTASGP